MSVRALQVCAQVPADDWIVGCSQVTNKSQTDEGGVPGPLTAEKEALQGQVSAAQVSPPAVVPSSNNISHLIWSAYSFA